MDILEEYKNIILLLLVLIAAALTAVIFIRQRSYCRRYDEQDEEGESEDTFIPGASPVFDTAEIYNEASSVILRLVLIDKRSGRKYPICMNGSGKNSIVIGRSKTCDIIVADDKTVSSRHCRFIRVGESILAEDLNSTNKTYLNGRLVLQPQLVRSGDVLTLGRMVLEISAAEEDE
ncbi:MAG: FHA domain-containing protein [Huintestinicola sp.]|uniref:FHA domain-containing protein n=1 Tax=Huintestinicola sp. TaxID=2981661 RepID=UPI003F11BBBE